MTACKLQEAIRILKVVRAVGQAHSMSHVLDVFRGSNSRNVRKHKHDSLPVHGIGKGVRQGFQCISDLAILTVLITYDVSLPESLIFFDTSCWSSVQVVVENLLAASKILTATPFKKAQFLHALLQNPITSSGRICQKIFLHLLLMCQMPCVCAARMMELVWYARWLSMAYL